MARRKRKSRSSKKTMKIGSSIFTASACYSKKRDASKGASTIRKQKHKARVIKSGGRYCVYKGGKKK